MPHHTPCLSLLVLVGVAMPGSGFANTPEPPPPPPRIVKPQTSCTPGKAIRLDGRRFGAAVGRVQVAGLPGTTRARVGEWGPRAVTVRLPADLSGIGDRAIKLRLWSADGRRSNTVECAFRASRERQKVRLSAWSIADCGEGSDHRNNRNTSSGRLAGCAHSGPAREGVDQWRTRVLAPGWALVDWHFEDRSRDGGSLGNVAGPGPEDGRLRARIEWALTGAGVAAYQFAIEIEGPRGTAPFIAKADPAP